MPGLRPILDSSLAALLIVTTTTRTKMLYIVVRVLADLLGVLSFVLVTVKLCLTKSCAGISGKAQILHGIVFGSRCLVIVIIFEEHFYYLCAIKAVFTVLICVNVFLIYGPHRRTHDQNTEVIYSEFLMLGCFLITLYWDEFRAPTNAVWEFSIILEAVALAPQVDLLYRIKTVDNYVVFHLLALGTHYMVFHLYRIYAEYQDSLSSCTFYVQSVLLALAFGRVFQMMRHREQENEYRAMA